jgi:hypothetical protein
MTPRSAALLSLLSASLMLTPVAHADQADVLFAAGEKAFEAKDFAAARARFLEAYELRPSFDVLANLGAVEIRLGLLAEATEHLSSALAAFPPSGDPATKRKMQRDLEDLRSKVGRVVVKGPRGATLAIDGRAAGTISEQGTQLLWLAPGEHQLVARRPGSAPDDASGSTTVRLQVTAGAEQPVELEFGAAREPVEGPAQRSGIEEEFPLWPSLVAGGVALVGLGAGIGLAAAASSAGSDADALTAALPSRGACLGASPESSCAEIQDQLESRDALSSASLALFVVGSAAAIGGGVLLSLHLLSPSEEPATAVSLRPWAGPGTAGALLTGAF